MSMPPLESLATLTVLFPRTPRYTLQHRAPQLASSPCLSCDSPGEMSSPVPEPSTPKNRSRNIKEMLDRCKLSARYGESKQPGLIQRTTDLPSIPTIQDCDRQKPKLSAIQLIAFAIINHQRRMPTGQEIISWIEKEFAYFRMDHTRPYRLEVEDRLMKLFGEYDPPIIPLAIQSLDPMEPGQRFEFRRCRFAIVTGHFASLFPTNSGVFPFLDLPPEIRIQIYEYALSFPNETWIIRSYNRWSDIRRRPYAALASTPFGVSIISETYMSCRLSKMLALLQVSKQIFVEAVPIFYRRHNFTIGKFSPVLPCHSPFMGMERCNYLRDVTISYEPASRAEETIWLPIFRMLRNCKELKRLDLIIQAKYVLNVHFTHWPGFDALCLIRGLKRLEVTPDARDWHVLDRSIQVVRRVKQHLEPLLTQPREETSDVRVTRAMQRKVQFSNTPLETGLLEITRKRKKTEQSDQDERAAEDSGVHEEKRRRD